VKRLFSQVFKAIAVGGVTIGVAMAIATVTAHNRVNQWAATYIDPNGNRPPAEWVEFNRQQSARIAREATTYIAIVLGTTGLLVKAIANKNSKINQILSASAFDEARWKELEKELEKDANERDRV